MRCEATVQLINAETNEINFERTYDGTVTEAVEWLASGGTPYMANKKADIWAINAPYYAAGSTMLINDNSQNTSSPTIKFSEFCNCTAWSSGRPNIDGQFYEDTRLGHRSSFSSKSDFVSNTNWFEEEFEWGTSEGNGTFGSLVLTSCLGGAISANDNFNFASGTLDFNTLRVPALTVLREPDLSVIASSIGSNGGLLAPLKFDIDSTTLESFEIGASSTCNANILDNIFSSVEVVNKAQRNWYFYGDNLVYCLNSITQVVDPVSYLITDNYYTTTDMKYFTNFSSSVSPMTTSLSVNDLELDNNTRFSFLPWSAEYASDLNLGYDNFKANCLSNQNAWDLDTTYFYDDADWDTSVSSGRCSFDTNDYCIYSVNTLGGDTYAPTLFKLSGKDCNLDILGTYVGAEDWFFDNVLVSRPATCSCFFSDLSTLWLFDNTTTSEGGETVHEYGVQKRDVHGNIIWKTDISGTSINSYYGKFNFNTSNSMFFYDTPFEDIGRCIVVPSETIYGGYIAMYLMFNKDTGSYIGYFLATPKLKMASYVIYRNPVCNVTFENYNPYSAGLNTAVCQNFSTNYAYARFNLPTPLTKTSNEKMVVKYKIYY